MSRTQKKPVHSIHDAEDRLRHARETLALVAFLSRTLGEAHFHQADLSLPSDIEMDAFECLHRLCSTAYDNLDVVHHNVMFTDVMDEGFKAAIRTAQAQGLTAVLDGAR